ncbi:hypothetical protein DB895_05985 [Flavobacterium psychrotolerans]|uniref:Uncharacterized protein n=1 Tax=Flavobacterium psychrotolerans TaxID=2169410 RepID=A0A2U1JLV8_9FLAO|nr:hypothetical protein DB895_05985 [Flavobacterium psychrotolerans]
MFTYQKYANVFVFYKGSQWFLLKVKDVLIHFKELNLQKNKLVFITWKLKKYFFLIHSQFLVLQLIVLYCSLKR